MSMNLTARNKHGEISLWQTPTWVTYACLVDENGKVGQRCSSSARRAMHIYLRWMDGLLSGVWTDAAALLAAKESNQEHAKYIRDAMMAPGLIVYFE